MPIYKYVSCLILLYTDMIYLDNNRNVKDHVRSNNLDDLIVYGMRGVGIKNFNRIEREGLFKIDLILQTY